MNRWGITLPLTGVPLAAHRELVKELPDLGYTDVWSAETAGTDAFTPLALAAEWTGSMLDPASRSSGVCGSARRSCRCTRVAPACWR